MDNQTTGRSFKYASKHSVAVVTLSFTALTCALTTAFLFAITLWSFLRKMFVYTYFMEVKMDTTFFSIPAGILCVPMVVFTILLKAHKFKYMLAFLVIQVITISLLFTGNFMVMVYRLDYSNETVRLGSTLPRETLNNTLYQLIAAYEKSHGNNHSTIDNIQIKFSCCGIDSKYDFVDVPRSCCPGLNCTEQDVWPKGCLRSIQEDVAWHKQITTSITHLFLLMCFFDLFMVSSVFISDHYKWKSVRKNKSKDENKTRKLTKTVYFRT